MDYPEACGKNEFLLLHHDVEFSLDKAYAMAKIEAEEVFFLPIWFRLQIMHIMPFQRKTLL